MRVFERGGGHRAAAPRRLRDSRICLGNQRLDEFFSAPLLRVGERGSLRAHVLARLVRERSGGHAAVGGDEVRRLRLVQPVELLRERRLVPLERGEIRVELFDGQLARALLLGGGVTHRRGVPLRATHAHHRAAVVTFELLLLQRPRLEPALVQLVRELDVVILHGGSELARLESRPQPFLLANLLDARQARGRGRLGVRHDALVPGLVRVACVDDGRAPLLDHAAPGLQQRRLNLAERRGGIFGRGNGGRGRPRDSWAASRRPPVAPVRGGERHRRRTRGGRDLRARRTVCFRTPRERGERESLGRRYRRRKNARPG